VKQAGYDMTSAAAAIGIEERHPVFGDSLGRMSEYRWRLLASSVDIM
jgi:hypothetical protein